MNYAVIIAGGRGERFWPKSRVNLPKQLLSLIDEKKTLIESTVERILPLIPAEQIYISTNQFLQGHISQVLKDNVRYVLEPLAKNTGPAIGLAATYIFKKDPAGVMVVLSSDHFIGDEEKFRQIIAQGLEVAAREEVLITIGLTPTRPETGYGYIEQGEKYLTEGEVYRVERFIEKPPLEKAKEMMAAGRFFWNGGIFIWSVQAILKAIQKHLPDLYQGLMKILEKINTPQEEEVKKEVFQTVKAISIDYGVMEVAEKVLMIKGDLPWDDVGSWFSLARIYPSDKNQNVIRGKGEHLALDTKESIIYNDCPHKIVATIGVSNLVIVNTEDAVLVIDKSRHQEVKNLVGKIKENSTWGRYL